MPDPTTEDYARAVTRGDDFEKKAKTLEAEVKQRDQRIRDLAGEVEALTAEMARLKAGQPTGTTPAEPFSVGIGLDANTEYATDAAFANLFHRFSGWGKFGMPWVTVPAVVLTADGYPPSKASAYSYLYGYASGEYELTWQGKCTVRVGGKLRQPDPANPQRVVFTQSVDGMGTVTVDGPFDPADPPRNFRLAAKGLPAGVQFNPDFIAAVKPFKVIRFMDWGRVNRCPPGPRVRLAEWCQTSVRGVAYELMAALSRESGAGVWVCVPDWADDQHVADMARVFRDGMAPGSPIYVEYSNEITFNSRFSGWPRVHEAARTDPDLTADDENTRHWQRCAKQARYVGSIFRREFGDQAARVRPVLSTQSSQPAVAEAQLRFLAAKYGPPADDFFAVACTAYYEPWSGDEVRPGGTFAVIESKPTPAERLDALFAAQLAAMGKPRSSQVRHREIARRGHGLPVVVYEANGLELKLMGASYPGYNAAAVASDSDPRAGDCVRAMFAAARRDYGAPLVVFYLAIGQPAKEGRYSAAPSLDRLDVPEWSALSDYARNPPG